jgi:hypothetical protein
MSHTTTCSAALPVCLWGTLLAQTVQGLGGQGGATVSACWCVAVARLNMSCQQEHVLLAHSMPAGADRMPGGRVGCLMMAGAVKGAAADGCCCSWIAMGHTHRRTRVRGLGIGVRVG